MRTLLFIAALLSVLAASLLFVHADTHDATDIPCPLCQDFVKRVVVKGEAPRKACKLSAADSASVPEEDHKLFDGCSYLLTNSLVKPTMELRREVRSEQKKSAVGDDVSEKIRAICESTALCPPRDEYKDFHAAGAAGFDIRVSPVNAMRGTNNAVRITVVEDNNNQTKFNSSFTSLFSYNEPFKYVWTDKTVHTGIFPVTPGQVTNIDLAGYITLPIHLQAPGKGTRSVWIGDPCFSGEFVGCKWGKHWKILHRLTELLNTLASVKDGLHVWGLLGDNFYDPHGTLFPQFFKQLSAGALATVSNHIPGNHDYWQHGKPTAHGYDTYGNGYVQAYGTDSVAAVRGGSAAPFNFSVDPSTKQPIDIENVFAWNVVGNVAYVTTSGAYPRSAAAPYLQQACQWIGKVKPDWVILLNHWSANNFGCFADMDAKELHDYIQTLDGCKQMASHIKWFEGHSHINKIVEPNQGFRYGGMGMSHGILGANFGIPFIDTYHGKLEVWYFPIAKDPLTDGDKEWKAIMDCVKSKGGLHQCTHLAESWLSQPN